MLIPNDYFLYINLVIIAIYFIFVIVGYKKGFMYEFLSLIYSIFSLFVSWLISPILANVFPIVSTKNVSNDLALLNKFIDIEKLINEAIYFVVIFVLLKLVYIVLSLIFKKVNKLPIIGSLNKILGVFLGIVNATLVTIILSTLLSIPVIKNGNDVKNNTLLKYINSYSNKFISIVIDNYDLSSIENQYKNFNADDIREQLKNWVITDKNNE